jgi:hypothetical protein
VRSFGGDFFPWYNTEHHHVGLGLFTPHDVHYGLAAAKRERRAEVLAAALTRHPERFPNGRPQPQALPTAVWINPPAKLADVTPPEMTMTQESRRIAIVDSGASYEADLETDRLEGPNLMPAELRVTAGPEPAVGPMQLEITMTQESRRVAIVDPGASYEADLEADRLEGPSLMSEDQCMAAVQ